MSVTLGFNADAWQTRIKEEEARKAAQMATIRARKKVSHP
jgi:hypothetical protein